LNQSWILKYSSANGYGYLSTVSVLINSSLSGVGGCYVYYDKASNGFYLYNDAATAPLGPLVAGSNLHNNQCTLNGTGATAGGSGNTLTMTLNLTFSASFSGSQIVYMKADDRGGLSSGWQNRGTWVGSASILLPVNVAMPPGVTVTYPITLSNPAPSGGVFITLASSNFFKVSVNPPSIFIPEGAMGSNLPSVTGIGLGSATIFASAPGLAQATGQVQVVASVTMSFAPASLTINVGKTQNLTLNLSAPAPSLGLTVTLSSTNTGAATVPATVSFGANATSVGVPVTGVAAGSATITASATGFPNASAGVTVTQAVGGNSFFLPGSLTIGTGATQDLTLNLSVPAPAGLTASLSSSNPGVATVPSTVSFTAGATNASVSVTGVAAGSATITASTPNFGNATASVAISSPPAGIILPANMTLAPGQFALYPVTLAYPAPSGGLFLTLTSSDPSKVTVTPTPYIFIPQGATAPSRAPSVTGIDIGSAISTASAPGVAQATGQVQVTSGEIAGATMSFSPASLTLMSSNTGVPTVPATVGCRANSTSVTVP